MNNDESKMTDGDLEAKTQLFIERCRKAGLRVTPQRIAIYRELLQSSKHPSAEMLYDKVKRIFPSISLDTVNRTLATLSGIGLAFVVEGSGGPKRYDANPARHQHFRCVGCGRIVDFHHKPFDNIKLPPAITGRFQVLRKTVYVEGLCDLCK